VFSAFQESERVLFISYAHSDDRAEHQNKFSALVNAIKADYQHLCGTFLRVFFDTDETRSMDDWELRMPMCVQQLSEIAPTLQATTSEA
jgi:hypothetical protein